MNFNPTALGNKDQKLADTLEVGSLKVKAQSAKIITYYFVAKDSQDKEVNGTIDSHSPYQAYKRLLTEYQLQVLKMKPHEADWTEDDGFESNFEAWNHQLKQEGIEPEINKAIKVKNMHLEKSTSRLEGIKGIFAKLQHKFQAINGRREDKREPKDEPVKFRIKRDFSTFYAELNSFVGWLLFFYLTYFFLASFSLERNFGLSQTLVIKTLSSPLVINICIFLLMANLTLTLKNRLFRRNIMGTAFLFFFVFGGYALLMANF